MRVPVLNKRSATERGKIYIGTSNVVIPGNKESFPTDFRAGSRLHYYASLFNSVEVNKSFYKTPLCKTYHKWSEDVPEDFRFTIKMSRDVTHEKNLRFDRTLIRSFMQAADGVGDKKGCLLIQFPGKITLDYYETIENILYQISQCDTQSSWKKAVEFRHSSWYTGETNELLRAFGATLVLHDIPASKITEHQLDSAFMYLRFHGVAGDYRGSYTNESLLEKAQQMLQWADAGKEVFAYFNNTIGDAFQNALTLKKMIVEESRR